LRDSRYWSISYSRSETMGERRQQQILNKE
jgi:hypothetical protein